MLLGEHPRPREEFARFAGKAVVVEGELYLEPTREVEEARADPLPVLREPGEIRLG